MLAVVCTIPGAVQAQGEPPAACSGKAALFTSDRGTKLWVVRRGEMTMPENPLRPLSRDNAVVLQVVVNGRLATAVGTDYANLRQGGAVRDVEREGAEPVRWIEGFDGLPPALRVVAEDGSVLIGPMRFASCEDAPTAKAVAPVTPKAAAAASSRRKKQEAAPEPPGMPKGAIDGLALPPGIR